MKKPQGEDKTVADPASNIHVALDRPNNASSIFVGANPSFSNVRCFDFSGPISLSFPRRRADTLLIPFSLLLSRALPSRVLPFSSVRSRISLATVAFPAMELAHGPAFGWPWVPRFIGLQSKLRVPHEIGDNESRGSTLTALVDAQPAVGFLFLLLLQKFGTTCVNLFCTPIGKSYIILIHYPCIISFILLPTTIQVFDQMPKSPVTVWKAITIVCRDNWPECVLFDLFKFIPRIGIKHDNYAFNSMLNMCSWELLNYGTHVHSVVKSLITMHFNCGCILDAYEGFEEAESALYNQVTYNAMKDGLVSMDRLEDALLMFREMHWDYFDPREASCGSRAILAICSIDDIMNGNERLKAIQLLDSHTVDNKAERAQLIANRHDVLKAIATETEAIKCMRDSRQTSLTPDNVDDALNLKAVKLKYEFASGGHLQFKRVVDHSNLFDVDDKDIDLTNVIEASASKAPLDTVLTCHWFAIEGMRPAIPKNAPIEAISTPSDVKEHEQKDKNLPFETRLHVKYVLSIELQLTFDKMVELTQNEYNSVLIEESLLTRKHSAADSVGGIKLLDQGMLYLLLLLIGIFYVAQRSTKFS